MTAVLHFRTDLARLNVEHSTRNQLLTRAVKKTNIFSLRHQQSFCYFLTHIHRLSLSQISLTCYFFFLSFIANEIFFLTNTLFSFWKSSLASPVCLWILRHIPSSFKDFSVIFYYLFESDDCNVQLTSRIARLVNVYTFC